MVSSLVGYGKSQEGNFAVQHALSKQIIVIVKVLKQIMEYDEVISTNSWSAVFSIFERVPYWIDDFEILVQCLPLRWLTMGEE